MFLLLGAVYVHHLPQMLGQVGIGPALLQDQASHVAATAVVLLLPGAVAAATDGQMRLSAGDLTYMLSLHWVVRMKALTPCLQVNPDPEFAQHAHGSVS